MARLFLIRHGEPAGAWGVVDDPGLSERGHEQARRAAEALATYGQLILLSSPLQRCRDTAGPALTLLNQTVGIEPRAGEIETPPDIADRRAWLASRFAWRADAAPILWSALEPSVRAWRDEVLGFARSLRGDVAVFTHFVAINVIVGASLGREATIVCRPDFASITELSLEDGALRLEKLGAQMQTSAGEAR